MLRLKAALDERNELRRGPDPTLVPGLRLDADEADFRATYVKFSKRTPPSSELAGCDDKRPLLKAALFAAGTVTSSRSRTRACGLCTGMLVNSASNWLVSRLPCEVAGMSASDLTNDNIPNHTATLGFHGGFILRLYRAGQSMKEKKGCFFTSSASPSPQPSRLSGSRVSSCKAQGKSGGSEHAHGYLRTLVSKSRALGDKYSGNSSRPKRILSYRVLRFCE